ncbi:TetR/AcrR family transcriptional regulator [Bacillus tianshenii]|uniref:TetR/AcrR family transcriptional regulator n=1 Tax=Sutcliffiella tianshenii TaxID=1463404 RepID=UPI001CD63AD3|nr:TetR/AcrR family transcriptional regulator [Bacillus tianshenii]MCA1322376.1 TetR/AcrR family transcriptional regulator [Bacillus tianshenii]
MARDRKFTDEELFHATKLLLLQHGYEGFTFSILADHLEVSRGTLYKYYVNKEELITDYMLFEMNLFLGDLRGIHAIDGFEAKFDFLISLIFQNATIHQIIEIVQHVPRNVNDKVRDNREKLDELHMDMYHNLQDFILIGRKEQKLKDDLPDGLLLGIIFQSIAIPNHFGVPHKEWVKSIKEILGHGMFKRS